MLPFGFAMPGGDTTGHALSIYGTACRCDPRRTGSGFR